MAHDFRIDIRRLRTSLLMWLSVRHWRRQTVFFGGGLAVGAAAVAMAKGGMRRNRRSTRILAWQPTAPLVITPLAYAVAAYVTMRWFNGAQGSGIPQIIAANELPSTSQTRDGMVSMRVAIGKALLLVFLLVCGASIGREGPSVQIGAAVDAVRRPARRHPPRGRPASRRRRGGRRRAFNTPLAGVVFAIEELGRRFEQRTNGTVILDRPARRHSLGHARRKLHLFRLIAANLSGWPDILAVLVCGVVGGALAACSASCSSGESSTFPGCGAAGPIEKMALFAGACGLIVGVIGLATGGATFGTGYSQAKDIIQGRQPSALVFRPSKTIVTLLSSMCGIPGGLFAPSLSAGAGFGHALEPFLPMVPPETVALLGVVGYFSGVVQSPLTAFVIVMEMTGDHDMMLPLMATSLLAYAVSRMVCKYPVYHAIAHSMVTKAGVSEGLTSRRAGPADEDETPEQVRSAFM